MRSDIQNWTTLQVKKIQVEELKKLREYPKQPLWEVVDKLLRLYHSTEEMHTKKNLRNVHQKLGHV